MCQMHRYTQCALHAWLVVGGLASVFVTTAIASDLEDFNRRAAQRDAETFRWLDRDNDGRLTVEEVQGNVDLQARFDDLDINRDGVITTAEFLRYVESRYGVSMEPVDVGSRGQLGRSESKRL